MTDLVRGHRVSTFNQMSDRLHHDVDGREVCRIMGDLGLGDRILTVESHGIRIGGA